MVLEILSEGNYNKEYKMLALHQPDSSVGNTEVKGIERKIEREQGEACVANKRKAKKHESADFWEFGLHWQTFGSSSQR